MFSTLLFIFISTTYAEEYIINNDECRLPYFEAFSEEANITYRPLPYSTCSDLDHLTYTTVEKNVAYLRINKENLPQYYLSEKEIDCCYRYIIRNGTEDEPDVGISATPCWFFNSHVRLQQDIVMVKCYMGADLIYENVHYPIVVKKSVKEKLERRSGLVDKPISVLLVVIDSVSRLNFMRTMPLTREFLKSNDFIEFVGYNKIDDNTFPNFNALLTGLNQPQSHLTCKPEQVGMLDRCPMIWYDYRDHGYVTAYAEDWAPISTYNYLKKGFKRPPTDYYYKPYVEASETLSITMLDSMPYCAGPETEGERILNAAKDFVTTFKGKPSFGIFWMNTFSHNYINSPSRMDKKVNLFFEDIQKQGVLNESIVVVLSDHGIRFGGIRKTVQGWFEERLPLNHISVPQWFQKKYPKKFANLKRNSKRLTSTFDMYMTLQDILALSSPNFTVSHSKSCQFCSSLFSDIPHYRSCKQAGIPEVWCTCIGKLTKLENATNSTELQKQASTLALRHLIETRMTTESDEQNLDVVTVTQLAVTDQRRKRNYMLMNFKTSENMTYQGFFRVKKDLTEVVKVLKLIRLY